jgi:hypothetical protein
MSTSGFYGVKTEPKVEPKPEPHTQTFTPRAMDPSHGRLQRIESLNPYDDKWVIKARVTSKSDIKTWHNKNGEGKLFSVNLLDESGEIKATGFNEQCDMFYELFQEGEVYYIESCKTTMAKKQFSNLNNIYELVFENKSKVTKVRRLFLKINTNITRLRYKLMFHKLGLILQALVAYKLLKKMLLLIQLVYYEKWERLRKSYQRTLANRIQKEILPWLTILISL